MFKFGIKCPKCDSTDVEPIDHETYKCNDCGHLFKVTDAYPAYMASVFTASLGSGSGSNIEMVRRSQDEE